jgi:molybdopterin-guanine dinucleotide biosynthesis protein A
MTGIILAGGKNKRMGVEKAFLDVCGQRVIDRVYGSLKAITSNIIIVTNSPLLYQQLPARIVTDLIPHQGPLGGIFTGLFYTTSFPALVLACDLPFVTSEFLKFLLSYWNESLDALIPKTPDGHQPLCAIYGKGAIPVLEVQLKRGDLRLYQALRRLKKQYLLPETIAQVDPEGRTFFNLNTPSDLLLAQRLCAKKHT